METNIYSAHIAQFGTLRRGADAADPARALSCLIEDTEIIEYFICEPFAVSSVCRFLVALLLLTLSVTTHQEIPKTLTDPYVSWRVF